MSASSAQLPEIQAVDMRDTLSDREKAFVDLYAQNGFTNATSAYHTLHPELKRDIAGRIASEVLKRPRVRRYVDSLLLPAPEKVASAKDQFLKKVDRITTKAEGTEQFGAALKGCELEAKVRGLFSHEETDHAQYMQFFDKVSITVNQQPQVQQQDVKVIEGQCE